MISWCQRCVFPPPPGFGTTGAGTTSTTQWFLSWRCRFWQARLRRWWWLSCSPVELFPSTCWHYLQHLVKMDAMKCALTSSTWNSTFSLRALLRVYTGAAAATASRSGLAMPLSKSEAAELDLAFFASRALLKASIWACVFGFALLFPSRPIAQKNRLRWHLHRLGRQSFGCGLFRRKTARQDVSDKNPTAGHAISAIPALRRETISVYGPWQLACMLCR